MTTHINIRVHIRISTLTNHIINSSSNISSLFHSLPPRRIFSVVLPCPSAPHPPLPPPPATLYRPLPPPPSLPVVNTHLAPYTPTARRSVYVDTRRDRRPSEPTTLDRRSRWGRRRRLQARVDAESAGGGEDGMERGEEEGGGRGGEGRGRGRKQTCRPGGDGGIYRKYRIVRCRKIS